MEIQSPDAVTDGGKYTPAMCLLPGEVIQCGPYVSPRDFFLGYTRNTVFVTNMRVVINSHVVYLFFLKWDLHQALTFKCGTS